MFTADKRSSQNMNRYTTPIGGFMTKKIIDLSLALPLDSVLDKPGVY